MKYRTKCDVPGWGGTILKGTEGIPCDGINDKITFYDANKRRTDYSVEMVKNNPDFFEPVVEFWKPQNGQGYYKPDIRHAEPNYSLDSWDGCDNDLRLYKNGLVCQSPQEAKSLACKIIEFILQERLKEQEQADK